MAVQYVSTGVDLGGFAQTPLPEASYVPTHRACRYTLFKS